MTGQAVQAEFEAKQKLNTWIEKEGNKQLNPTGLEKVIEIQQGVGFGTPSKLQAFNKLQIFWDLDDP